mgnify:CR=1 FL=1
MAAKYKEGKTDEFMPPLIFAYAGEQRVRDNDVVLFFNFRADRARQLSQAFLFEKFDGFDRGVWPRVHFVTLTQYDVTYPSPVYFRARKFGAYPRRGRQCRRQDAVTHRGNGKVSARHLFFNGGVERAFPGEERKIVPSPKVATYDLQPEMSALQVTDEVCARMANYDLIILNFANPDMVGHTGVVEAGIKAVETVDACVARIVPKLLELDGKCLITADHGNCELMRNPDGSPNTAHTTNLVHVIYVAKDAANFVCHDGILADVAPTLLFLLGLPQPKEMTGHNLLVRKSKTNSGHVTPSSRAKRGTSPKVEASRKRRLTLNLPGEEDAKRQVRFDVRSLIVCAILDDRCRSRRTRSYGQDRFRAAHTSSNVISDRLFRSRVSAAAIRSSNLRRLAEVTSCHERLARAEPVHPQTR